MTSVRDIMFDCIQTPTVHENSCFRDVLEAMNLIRMGAVAVVNAENKLIGIVTDGDLRRLILKTQDTLAELFMKRVTMIMTANPKTIHPDSSIEDCLTMLKQRKFWVVPVVDTDDRLAGMVHLHNLLEAMDI